MSAVEKINRATFVHHKFESIEDLAGSWIEWSTKCGGLFVPKEANHMLGQQLALNLEINHNETTDRLAFGGRVAWVTPVTAMSKTSTPGFAIIFSDDPNTKANAEIIQKLVLSVKPKQYLTM